MSIKKKKPKPKAKKKLSAEQRKLRKIKRDHVATVRTVFRNLGFDRAVEIAEKQLVYEERPGEFDDAFVSENLIVLVEYTSGATSNVGDHLKNKKIIYQLINADVLKFISFLRDNFPAFNARLGSKYHPDQYKFKIIYCSLNDVESEIKKFVQEPVYLDFPQLKYFEKITSAIKLSGRPEFLHFLGIDPSDVAISGKFPKKSSFDNFPGSLLPEASSGFPKGYKVVSFYADAASLLSRAYVLRRDGWRGSFQAYQRMVQGPKIEAIRKKLRSDQMVFVNNLIAVLPPDTHPVKPDGQTANIAAMTKTEAVTIAIPAKANSIGLIDGQHRLFSYYESKDDDPTIAKLRHQQNLLVTGIIYPASISQTERERFEAELFLSINSNQTNAPTALKQEIEVVLNPYGHVAIGKQVMQRLATSAPLEGHVETYFFDKGKLKTSSIVSFGLGPLLKLSGNDSIFNIFKNSDKDLISTGDGEQALLEYIKFSSGIICTFLGAVKSNVPSTRWTSDPSIEDRILTVTYVNSFLIVIRKLIEFSQPLDFPSLSKRLKGIDQFPFKSFHSSQYGRMAEKIYETHFS